MEEVLKEVREESDKLRMFENRVPRPTLARGGGGGQTYIKLNFFLRSLELNFAILTECRVLYPCYDVCNVSKIHTCPPFMESSWGDDRLSMVLGSGII
jgi:hypothetical protein